MSRVSKCKSCEKEITKEEKHIYGGKGYCKNCFDKLQGEKEEYNLLLSTICEYLQMDRPTGLILKQIKQYKEEFKYSYGGITYTLYYIKAIEGKSFSETKFGIALVKYYYEKAKAYFEQQQKISNSMQNVKHEEVKVREVKVNLNKVFAKKTDFLININDLLGGE